MPSNLEIEHNGHEPDSNQSSFFERWALFSLLPRFAVGIYSMNSSSLKSWGTDPRAFVCRHNQNGSRWLARRTVFRFHRTEKMFEMLQRTVTPQAARHRKVINTVPAAAHGSEDPSMPGMMGPCCSPGLSRPRSPSLSAVPETLATKKDIEERLKKMQRFASANYDHEVGAVKGA